MARDRRDEEYDDRDDRDDRPRGRDDDEDRPRRRRRDDDGPPTKQASVLGILALIGGIPSVLVTFIPCCGWVAGVVGGLIVLTLGIIGLVQASGSNGRIGKGLPLAGTILGAAAVLFSFLWMLFFTVLAATTPTTPAATGAVSGDPVSATEPVDARVTAEEITKEFAAGRDAADAKYTGKVIEVTGVIHNVDVNDRLISNKVFLDSPGGATVQCDFGEGRKPEVQELQKGQTVVIRGRYKGRILGDPQLKDCIVMPGGTGKGVRKVTAEKLRKEADEDLAAATKKYGDQPVEVSGQVAGIDRTTPDEVVVGVGEGMRGDVLCVFAAKAAGLTALKVGQQVRIRGTCIMDEGAVSIVTLKDCTLVK